MKTQGKKLDFNGQNIYVGIDTHLKSWTVTIMAERLSHKTFSQPPNPEILHQYLVRNFPGAEYHSAYEAGFCGYWIHNKLNSLGIKSIVVNPADIPTTNKEKTQKEDARDSRKIAKCLRNGDLKPIYVISENTLKDRSLLRMRASLVEDLSRNKCRIKSFLYFHGIEIPEKLWETSGKLPKRYITWLESISFNEPSGKNTLNAILSTSIFLKSKILEVTKQIKDLSEANGYNENVSLLKTIPGIGLITAMTILTEIETINRFENSDKLCSFIGLVPSTNSSGDTESTGNITKRRNATLRTAIIESAWTAARLDPVLSLCYHKYSNKMESNKAIIRIGKKLLNRIKYVLKNKQPYVSRLVN